MKNGWLSGKRYAHGARKGWLALVSYLDSNGDLKNVSEDTNKKDDLNHYLTRATSVISTARLRYCGVRWRSFANGTEMPSGYTAE